MKHLFVLFTAVGIVGLPAAARADEYLPSYDRIRQRLQHTPSPAFSPGGESLSSSATARANKQTRSTVRRSKTAGERDSVWNGLLIGAGIGAGSGYLWARQVCGSSDSECFYIAAPVGVLAGAGIGAAVGALLDAFTR